MYTTSSADRGLYFLTPLRTQRARYATCPRLISQNPERDTPRFSYLFGYLFTVFQKIPSSQALDTFSLRVANVGTGVLMGYKVIHFCDLTEPPKGL